jgi:tetratricopeptide (TPR) repeat protein
MRHSAKILLLLIFVTLLLAPLTLAQTEVTPTEAMQAGNTSYESGQFNEAIAIYQSIVDAGIHDSALYFNLGNAYFKQGDLGRAIVNYLRAYRLDPRDSAIVANLAIARLQTLDRLDDGSESTLANLVEVAEEWLTLREAAILALFLWLLVSILLVVAILFERWRRYSLWAAGILCVFLLIGLFSMASRTYRESSSPQAVIVADEVDVTSGPGNAEQYVVEFNLHSGAEVRITDNRPGWRRVALPGADFQGWVPAEAVEPVLPQ